VWALHAEYERPWKEYQKRFRTIEYDITLKHYNDLLSKGYKGSRDIDKEIRLLKKKLAFIQNRREKIEQIWLQDLGITDRCTTCHQGIDNPWFSEESQPFKTHSGEYLRYHPIKKYGCSICHEGQGVALTVKTAHGEVDNWRRPLLKAHYVQSSCGKCHFMQQALPLSAGLQGAPVFTEGWRLFQEYSCIGCHKLSGYKRPERIGPPLNKIGSKVKKEWLIRWLKNPKDYLPYTKMPRYIISDEEISYIVSFLMSLRSKYEKRAPLLKMRNNRNEQNRGKVFIKSLGCLGCHIIGREGVRFGPDLTNIGNKVRPEWLYQFLKKPKDYDPKTIIPDFVLSEDEISSIVAYLMSLKKDEKPIHTNTQPEDIEKGKRLISELGCTGCHEIKGIPFKYNAPEFDGIGDKRVDELTFGNIKGVEKTLINWMKIKVMEPERFATDKIITRMPTYDFNEEQGEALVTFLLSLRKNSIPVTYKKGLFDPDSARMKGEKTLERYNCLGCHKINNKGGSIAPDLTNEAKKSRPEWLFNFLKKPYKIRPEPILKAKMPNFNLPDKDVKAIIEYLAYIAKEPYPYNLDKKKEIYLDDIRAGEKLYHEIFACIGCHTVNGRGGQVGPEHTDVASRLKRQWLEQWLKNPQAIKPDVRMPRFKFKDWEFEALTDYVMTLGRYRFVQPKKID
jgi:mono/diheme cytochrome c family protein